MNYRILSVSLLAFSSLIANAHAEAVGKLTAVQTSVSRSGSALAQGSAISLGDSLRSNATGLGIILFKDQSSAKLGPNSSLVIDEFVYGGGGGSSAVRMDRGITRFFGGRISKKGRMQITTPHVVLAVRGGIIDLAVQGGRSVATLRAGKLTCSSNGQTKVITKPGMSCVSGGGSISVARNAFDFSILDSRNRIAGTNTPGTKGPDVDTKTPCVRNGAFLSALCNSSNGQLPGPKAGGNGRPGNPSTGSDDRGGQPITALPRIP